MSRPKHTHTRAGAVLRDYYQSFRGCAEGYQTLDDDLLTDESSWHLDETAFATAPSEQATQYHKELNVSYDVDLQRVIKRAQEQGFRYDRTTGGHHRLYARNGKDIIVTSGTPGTHNRGWENFMSDMRRAGYVEEATTSLGDVLSGALKSAAPNGGGNGAAPPPKAPQEEAPRTQVAALLAHAGTQPPGTVFTVEQFSAALSTRFPTATIKNCSSLLSYLKGRGEMALVRKGYWRLPTEQDKEAWRQEQMQATAVKVPAATAPSSVSAVNGSGEEDLARIDTALAALARLEGDIRAKIEEAFSSIATIADVVTQNREVIRQMHDLRKKLNDLKF